MAINFPNSPAINDLYTFDGRTWIWNGYGWDAVAIGLPTTPGGSDTQIQFNNAGVFGGSANLTWDGSSMLVVGLFRTSTIDPTGFSGSGIDTPGTIGAIGDLGGNGNATVMRIDDLSLYVKVQAGNSGLLADNPTGVTTVGDIDAQGNSSVLAIDDDNQRATFNKKFVITDTGSFYLWNAGTSTYWYYTPDAVTGVLVPTDTGSGSLP